MLIEGLNLVRDEFIAQVTQASIGTGTTQETSQDSSLETPIGVTTTDITSTVTDQYVELSARFPSSSAGDEEITEILWANASTGLSIDRITFAATTYSYDYDLVITSRWYFGGRR